MIQDFERELQATKSPQVKAATRELFEKVRARRLAAVQTNASASPQLTRPISLETIDEKVQKSNVLDDDVREDSSSGDSAKAVPSGQTFTSAATSTPLPDGRPRRRPLDPKDFCTPREPSPVNNKSYDMGDTFSGTHVDEEMQTKKKIWEPQAQKNACLQHSEAKNSM